MGAMTNLSEQIFFNFSKMPKYGKKKFPAQSEVFDSLKKLR
jgi:hypothetical protein